MRDHPLTARLWRFWYYFRLGYGTYLTFLLGAVNTLVVVWYLAIAQMPDIQRIFGHFIPFAVVVTIIGVPAAILIGLVHFKRSRAYASEMDITVESNPYNYRVVPGKEQDLYIPMWIAQLDLFMLVGERLGGLTAEEKERLLKIRQGFVNLRTKGDFRVKHES